MMKRGLLLSGPSPFCCGCSPPTSASALTIKLGSLAPVGSPWELGAKRIAAEWERISGGTVTVKIYAGGVAGDEPDMIRKMRIGTLNAALITVTGLQGIFNGVKTLSYPLLLRSDDELAYVLDKMRALLRHRAAEARVQAHHVVAQRLGVLLLTRARGHPE